MKVLPEKRFHELLSQFHEIKPILVVGDVGVDQYTYGHVSRISPEAPVPILEVSNIWHKLGLAANVSDNLKELGVTSTLCGVIGNDRNADLFEELLEEKGLKTWGLVRSGHRRTTLKERVTTKNQQICRVDFETNTPLTEKEYQKILERADDFVEDHSCLIIEDYGKGLINEVIGPNLIRLFKEHGKLTMVDPSRTTPPLYYKGATLLKPNALEAELIVKSLGYRCTDIKEMAEIIMDKLEIEKLVITLGGDGMALLDRTLREGVKIIPTAAEEVFDVSGAGDTAISAICASLMSGASLEEACWVGNCASGVVVSKKGTATVSQAELIKFYKHKMLTKVQEEGADLP